MKNKNLTTSSFAQSRATYNHGKNVGTPYAIYYKYPYLPLKIEYEA